MTVFGQVAPGFEDVRVEFERNFAKRGEIGAAVAAYWRGEKVVDLWGGRRDPKRDAPWNEDTLVVPMSSTKGFSAMTLAVANARGWLDYEAPAARYWPEFAQNGKGAITVRQLLGLRKTPLVTIVKALRPGSMIFRSCLFSDLDWNDRHSLEVELPAGNGVGTARAMARAYSAFAEAGAELGITPETMARITAPPDITHPVDEVLGVRTCFALGFLRPGPGYSFGSSPRVFGAPGAGGSFAFADPDARVGFAYVMNKLDAYLFDDPREKTLRDAVYRALHTTPTKKLVPRRAWNPAEKSKQ